MIRKVRELSTFLKLKVDSSVAKHCLLCLNRASGQALCQRCRDDLPVTLAGCEICGEAYYEADPGYVPQHKSRYCGHCLRHRPAYDFCRSAFNYDFPVNRIIQQLKYHEQGYWAAALADAGWPAFKQHFSGLTDALLVPVPMHASDYKTRRDNHAELLARRLSAWSGYRTETGLVIRTLNTTRQAELSGKARRANLKHAFKLNKNKFSSTRPVIVVDDVMTTGTTINTIARLIKQHGDAGVYGFTLAKRSLND